MYDIWNVDFTKQDINHELINQVLCDTGRRNSEVSQELKSPDTGCNGTLSEYQVRNAIIAGEIKQKPRIKGFHPGPSAQPI